MKSRGVKIRKSERVQSGANSASENLKSFLIILLPVTSLQQLNWLVFKFD